MWTVLGIGLLVVVAVILFTPRLRTAFMAQWNKIGRAAESKDPVAQMQLKADQAKVQLRKWKDALVKCQGLISTMESQEVTDEKDENRLTSLIKRAMSEGKGDTDPVLLGYAKQLKSLRSRRAENKQQLANQQQVYSDVLEQIKVQAQNIEALERDAQNLGVRLETSQAQAELADTFSQFDQSGLGDALGGADKYKRIAEKQIAENNAKLKVNRDLGGGTDTLRSYEATADAQDILAEFRK